MESEEPNQTTTIKDEKRSTFLDRSPLQTVENKENTRMAMTSNKENIIYEEDEEEEVFFGEVTEKEKRKASKFAKRRTIVFTPGFREDRKLMRYTMDPARLAALAEEAGSTNSDVDDRMASSDDKENFCNAEHVERDSNGDAPDTAGNNGNNSNNAALDVSGDLFDSPVVMDGNEENIQSAKESNAEVNELINMLPKLDVSSEKDNLEVKQIGDTDISSETSENAEQSESLSMSQEKINCLNLPVHSTDLRNMCEQPAEISMVTDGNTNESFTRESCTNALQKTPTVQLIESDKDVNETPTNQAHINEGYVEETPMIHSKQLENFVEETPTIQFKNSSEYIEETPTVEFKKPDSNGKEGTEALDVCREETPTVIVNKPKECMEETPLAELKNSEKHLETPTIQLKYLSGDTDYTPTIQFEKHRENVKNTPALLLKDQKINMEETPTVQFLNPAEYTEETPTVVFKKSEKCSEETPTIQFKNPAENIEETPTVVFKKPEKCVEETPTVQFKNPVEDIEETPTVVFKNPGEYMYMRETPTVKFEKQAESIEDGTATQLKQSMEYSEETPTIQFKPSEGVFETISLKEPDAKLLLNISSNGSSIADDYIDSSKDTNWDKTPTVKSKVVPNALHFGTPHEHQNGSCDETSTVNFKPGDVNVAHSAPNSARIGFKRSSTSAFQTTPRQIDTEPALCSLDMSPHDTAHGNKVTECTSPSVIFKETNFSPTLKIKDVKRPNTLPMNLEINSSQLSFDIHEKEIMAQDVSSEQLLKPFIAGQTDEQYIDSGLPSTPTYLPMFQRGAWSLDSALRTTPELITEEPFPKLDFDIDLESPGRNAESDMAEILAKKKRQLEQLRLEKEKIHQRLTLKQTYGSRQDVSGMEPRSPKSACPMPTASTLPRVRYKDIQALSLASKELEAVTQLHTLTNSHRSVKVIKKPRSAHTKHVTVTAKEASRLHWLDTVVTPVTVKHLPNRKAISATKPILTQRPTDFTYPYHEEQPAIVVVNKSRRSSTGGIQTKPLPLVDELETGLKKNAEN